MSALHKLQIFIVMISIFDNTCVNGIDAPSVFIPNEGMMIGKFLKMFRTQNIKAYLGIKYAEAERFSPPLLINSKTNSGLNATKIGPKCWQNKSPFIDSQTEAVLNLLTDHKYQLDSFDEDCLYLNIFIPEGIPGANGYAVVVWFHSGDFSIGNAFDVDPFQIVYKQNIIVITVAYRLNIFGFLSTSDGEAQGNFGLMDQSAALFWINQRINYFGGDPNKITIMGHSAGSVSVGLHLTSGKWSTGAFSKAIMMSGNPLKSDIVKLPSDYENFLDIISNTFGCIRRPSSLLIQCLKRIDAKVIIENLPYLEWCPVVDFGLSNISEAFIREHPLTTFKNGNFQKVPLLIGITDMEDALIIQNIHKDLILSQLTFDEFIEQEYSNDLKKFIDTDESCTNNKIGYDALSFLYKETTQSHDRNFLESFARYQNERHYIAPFYKFLDEVSPSENTYAYKFDYQSQTSLFNMPDWVTVPKYFDQLFIWGIPYKQKIVNNKEWNTVDKKISDVVMTLWANFAKTSNPTLSNVYIKWSPYDRHNQSLLIIDENFELTSVSKPKTVEFWNSFYPKLLEFAIECCNLTNRAGNNSLQSKRIAFLYLVPSFLCTCFCFSNIFKSFV